MKRFWLGFCSFLLDILLVCALTYCMYRSYIAAEGNFFVAGILECVFFFLSWALMPALHEAGHLLCGKTCGMRLISVRFSFLEIYRTGKKLVCRVVNPFSSKTAGACRMYPRSTENIEKKFAFFAAGGLLFNAVYLAVLLPVVFLIDNSYLWAIVGITLPYCAYLLLVNLLPFGKDYDGAVVVGLLQKDPSQITAAHLFAVQGYLAQGLTPGEIDKDLYFNLPQLPEDDENFALLQYYRYAYYLDRGEVGAAVKSITRVEDCLEYIPTEYLTSICSELTFTYSHLQKNKNLAERYHAYVERQKESTHATERERAALAYALLCENQSAKEKSLNSYKNALESEPLEGVKKYEEKLLDELYGVS